MNLPRVLATLVAAAPTFAAPAASFAAPTAEPVPLTLAEALDLAVRHSFSLRQASLDRADASQQVRSALSVVLPQLRGQARYTRTFEALDPFAGSDAGAAFQGLDAVQWLQFNEAARTDGDPSTEPITLGEFQQRQSAALSGIDAVPNPDANPFLVENGFFFGLTLSQVLYDGAAFSSLDGAKVFEEALAQAEAAERLRVVRAVASAFYDALLLRERLKVVQQAVDRAQSNVADTRARVELGVQRQLDLLTAEVELANRQTEALRTENDMENVVDTLRQLVALPDGQRIEVRGELVYKPRPLPEREAAVAEAMRARPDFMQARSTVRVQEASESAAFGALLPQVFLDANLSANGAVPDDRSSVQSAATGADPFALRREERGFFDDAYWFPVFAAGLRLEWNLFDGFANYARLERERIALRKARIAVEQVSLQIQVEVERSLRALRTTQQQLETQERVRALALQNYEQAETLVREGAATQFDLRQASQQLDESRFNLLQAVHDHLVAWVEFQVASGTPPQMKGQD